MTPRRAGLFLAALLVFGLSVGAGVVLDLTGHHGGATRCLAAAVLAFAVALGAWLEPRP